MPIEYTELVAPVGPFEEEFLEDEMDTPDENQPEKTKLQVRIETYITEGYGKVAALAAEYKDTPARNWALYRLFHQTYLIKSNNPGSETEIQGLGARSFSKAQIEAFETEAQGYLSAFHTAMMDAVVASGGRTAPTYSGQQTRTIFEY
jgi:hypothetical protein